MFALLVQAIDSAGPAILIIDTEDRVVWVNQAFTGASGYEPDEIIGKSADALCAGDSADDSYSLLRQSEPSHTGTWQRELHRIRRDGTSYIVEEIVTPLRDQTGALTHLVAVSHDITQTQEALRKERLLATQDILTGLACRAHIVELLKTALAEAQQSDHILSVLFIDLDGFKQINDSHGHHIGDATLRAVAARLQSVVRSSDTVARFGGDEFVILLPMVSSRGVAKRIGMHIVDQLSQPFAFGSGCHLLSASVGVAFYPEHGQSSESLLISADKAMYRAKRKGGNQIQTPDRIVKTMRPSRFRQTGKAGDLPYLNGPDTHGSRHPGSRVDS
jgi:diguanylate cyclase (GGDEF)-like protein/PAS domain S-box-containing protein